MEEKWTERGFAVVNFDDASGEACSLQESSAACEEGLVWLGVDIVEPVLFTPGAGWTKVVLPEVHAGEYIMLSGRMHLTQSHVRELLPYLQRFAETGSIKRKVIA